MRESGETTNRLIILPHIIRDNIWETFLYEIDCLRSVLGVPESNRGDVLLRVELDPVQFSLVFKSLGNVLFGLEEFWNFTKPNRFIRLYIIRSGAEGDSREIQRTREAKAIN